MLWPVIRLRADVCTHNLLTQDRWRSRNVAPADWPRTVLTKMARIMDWIEHSAPNGWWWEHRPYRCAQPPTLPYPSDLVDAGDGSPESIVRGLVRWAWPILADTAHAEERWGARSMVRTYLGELYPASERALVDALVRVLGRPITPTLAMEMLAGSGPAWEAAIYD